MVNEIAKQKFIYQLNKVFDYANNNGLSFGIYAWVGDAFEDADKEPFDKTNTPWHINNTAFFNKTACFDNEDKLDKLTFFVLNTLHDVPDPALLMSWGKCIQEECNKSAAKLITNQVSDTIKKGRVHNKTKSKTKEK